MSLSQGNPSRSALSQNAIPPSLTREQNKNISPFPSHRGNLIAAPGFRAVDKQGDKAVAHLFAILFFMGLLVALATLLEVILKENWGAMRAALAGAPMPAPRARVQARPQSVVQPQQHAAA